MSKTIVLIDGAWLTLAVTACKSFPGRSRFVRAEPGCEEVPDCAIMWASQYVTARKMKIAGEVAPDVARAFLRGRR